MKNKIKIVTISLATVLAVGGLTACSSTKGSSNAVKTSASASINAESNKKEGAFSSFEGQDMDGKAVNQSILKGKKATVLTFWFNDCGACVGEMPELEKLSKKLKEKNAALIGVNSESKGGDAVRKRAKEILKQQKATYRNITISNGDKACQYISDIMAFPVSIIVDQDGNIIGDPIGGRIDDTKIKEILDRIASIKN